MQQQCFLHSYFLILNSQFSIYERQTYHPQLLLHFSSQFSTLFRILADDAGAPILFG